jgi:type I restriction enzyme M protein
MVLPDNVLFESGVAATIRRRLMKRCDVHTLMRLSTGLFYAQGVKANVIFFDKVAKKGVRRERNLWVYNLRGTSVSPKQNPLCSEDIADFVKCYCPGVRGNRRRPLEQSRHYRWRPFKIDEILKGEHCKVDISWVVSAPQRTNEVRADLIAIAHLIESDLRDASRLSDCCRRPSNRQLM